MAIVTFVRTLAIIPIVLAGAACGGNDEGDADPTATTPGGGIPSQLTTITVSDNKFTPVGLQVPVGTTITWQWTGSSPHSVKGTFDGEAIQSPQLTGTGVFLFAFQKAGVFQYECGVHGPSMAGKVTMQ